MARVVPADKRLPDDDSERLNIGHRASQPRAVQSIYALRSLMASKIVEARSIASHRSKGLAEQCSALRSAYARRSLIAARMSATTSAFGFAPMLPLPCRRTLTLPASRSRPPMTSMVWTFAFSASWILPLILLVE